MPSVMPAKAVLDRYFLEMRCKVLDIAAAMDRVQNATGAEDVSHDTRLEKLREAINVLVDGRGDRAARVQMIFSDQYDPDWVRPRVH